MDKLTKEQIEYLRNVLHTCSLCGIDAVSIENNIVRGQNLNNNKGTFLLDTDNILDSFEFSSIGIGRIKTLMSRLSLLDNFSNLNITYDTMTHDNGDIIVNMLLLKAGKVKVEFRCTDSRLIKAPRMFKDNIWYEFNVSNDIIQIMSKAVAAIETNQISFSSNENNEVVFRTTDLQNDLFEHEVDGSFDIADDAKNRSFFFSYSIKNLLPLFKVGLKDNEHIHVQLSSRGIMNIKVNGFNLYILPEI